MNQAFHVIIPARLQSTRLPGKLMMEIKGMTVLERVYRQALQANPRSITIAADSLIIAEHAAGFGASVVMTSTHHQSGTERLAEMINKGMFQSSEIIVNVQGDEPFIAPQLIQQVANSLQESTSASVATLCWPVEDSQQFHNPNVVKVVRDQLNQALYFSRSPIPANRDEPGSFKKAFRHIGLYAYRAAFLMDYANLPVCDLECQEALEQLRFLWAGYKIQVEQACQLPLQDINTLDDLILARTLATDYR